MAKFYVQCGDVQEIIDRKNAWSAACDAVGRTLDDNMGMIALDQFCTITEHGFLEDDGSNMRNEDEVIETDEILIHIGMEPEFE